MQEGGIGIGIGSNVVDAGGREAERWQVGLVEVQGGESNPFLCCPPQVGCHLQIVCFFQKGIG